MASPMSWEEARDHMRKLREEQVRSSDEVVDLWDDVLCDFSYKLGDEVWMIYEQVCVAACDCGRQDIIKQCLDALRSKFPDSMRVKRLQGLAWEARGSFDKAEQLYNKIIEKDPTNSLVHKRLVGVLKAQNRIPDAIKKLNDYVKQYMSDQEAWQELCDLYLMECDYSKAAFCMEESILSNAHNHLYHQKFAEIKYSQGGQENIELAKAYFAQAAKLNPHNMRALYGLFMSASYLATSQKSQSRVKKDSIRHAAWAAEQINQRYKDKLDRSSPNYQMETVGGMLDSMLNSYSSS